MRTEAPFIIHAYWWAVIVGGMVMEIGEHKPAFVFGWEFPVVFSIITWATFMLGFFAGKENRK